MCQHCAHEEEGWTDLLQYDETYTGSVDSDGDEKTDDEEAKAAPDAA